MSLPSVSVIIPARDATTTLPATLAAIASQTYAGPIEVIVAEGGSTDSTRRVAEASPGVVVVDNPSGRTPDALNAAITASSGEIIVRCDAHAVLPDGYVERAVQVLAETRADVAGGRQDAVGSNPFGRAVAAAHNSWIAGGAAFRTAEEPGPAETVYLGVFPRATFDRFGLFDPEMYRNQDFELNHRVRSHGGLVYFHPDLTVAYLPRDTWRGLWRQYWSYGAGKRRMLRRNPNAVRLRQLLPLGLVLGLAISGALVRISVIPLIAALVTYSAVLASSVRIGSAPQTRYRLPLVAATMHLAWGLGFLLGRNR